MLTYASTRKNDSIYAAFRAQRAACGFKAKYDRQGNRRRDRVKRRDKRGKRIKFKMTYAQWLWTWLQSGHLYERGSLDGQYCMSRKHDIGPYKVGNVFIQLTSQNSRDAKLGSTHTDEVRAQMSKDRKGVKHTAEHNDNIRKAMKLVPDVTCPHCGRSGQNAAMHKHHFDLCKLKP